MAAKNMPDPGYTTDLHIRMKSDERDLLQKKANEFGVTLSQAARRILFRRMNGESDENVSEKEAHFRTLQAMQNTKAVFKKISIDIGRYVTSYEKSVSSVNKNGEPVVNTEMTLRTSASIVTRLMEAQEAINIVIRTLGGTEIHVAAKPPVGTSIGRHLAGETSETKTGKRTPERKPGAELSLSTEIPIEFRSDMFTVSLDGVLVADCETFMDGQYEKIRLQVKVTLYRNRRAETYTIDAVDFASRYKNVIPHLTSGKLVILSGEFDFSVGAYNGVSSASNATVEIKTLTLPPATK